MSKDYSVHVNGYHARNEIYDGVAVKQITADATCDAELKAAGHNSPWGKIQYDLKSINIDI